jgi:ornithine cyclodeaminase/alanine dehydrogenase-like protein (mu-crystallin family)
VAGWGHVRPLSSLVALREPRGADDDVTLFKSLGTGIADVSLGIEVLERAQARGLGVPLATPERVAPRLRRAPEREGEQHGARRL